MTFTTFTLRYCGVFNHTSSASAQDQDVHNCSSMVKFKLDLAYRGLCIGAV